MAHMKAHTPQEGLESKEGYFGRGSVKKIAQTRSGPRSAAPPGLDCLDIIGDCVDLVDFYVKCDQIAHGKEPTGPEGSQKKCRNCS